MAFKTGVKENPIMPPACRGAKPRIGNGSLDFHVLAALTPSPRKA